MSDLLQQKCDRLAAQVERLTRERDGLAAVGEAARRYLLAVGCHEARDWQGFEVEDLASVDVEHERLEKAVAVWQKGLASSDDSLKTDEAGEIAALREVVDAVGVWRRSPLGEGERNLRAVVDVFETYQQRGRESSSPEWISLPLGPNEDTQITCIFCRWEQPCEFALLVKRSGERALVGIHARCVDPLRKRNVEGRRK